MTILTGPQAKLFTDALNEYNRTQKAATEAGEYLSLLLRSWGIDHAKMTGYNTENREVLLSPVPEAPIPPPPNPAPPPLKREE